MSNLHLGVKKNVAHYFDWWENFYDDFSVASGLPIKSSKPSLIVEIFPTFVFKKNAGKLMVWACCCILVKEGELKWKKETEVKLVWSQYLVDADKYLDQN